MWLYYFFIYLLQEDGEREMEHFGDLNIALLNITTNTCLKGSYLFLADELDPHFLDLCKT